MIGNTVFINFNLVSTTHWFLKNANYQKIKDLENLWQTDWVSQFPPLNFNFSKIIIFLKNKKCVIAYFLFFCYLKKKKIELSQNKKYNKNGSVWNSMKVIWINKHLMVREHNCRNVVITTKIKTIVCKELM